MIQWKQRLYAFLLRRLLGPFLDAASTKKLHDSIDFSLHEGRFTLKDIGLSADHLTKILSSSSSNLSIRRARIECLEIYLTLRENDYNASDPENSAPQSSLAWRAMKLGTSNSNSNLPAVSLIAEIKIDGVYIELEPNNVKAPSVLVRPSSPQPQDESKNYTANSSRSVIGSYVDAALNSLQLTLKISNLNVKLCSERSPKFSESWVEVRLASASYRDLETPSTTNAPSDDKKTVVNKSLEFSGLNIKAGESILEVEGTGDENEVATFTSQNVSTLVLAQGTGHVYIRVVEYTDDSSSEKATKQSDTEPNIQQDIEVKLNQQLNLSIDCASILQLGSVAQGFSRELDYELDEAQTTLGEALPGDTNSGDEHTDQEDLKALTGIMKQYQEAYHSVERNELRGGILVPTNAYEDGAELDDEENGTFDIFFDANDQSFMHYKSVLIESIMIPEPEELNGFVHTKLRMHLLSGCFKVVFTDPNRRASFRRPEEYMLLSYDDLNVSSSLSARTSEHSLSISHFEIEDAQLDTTQANAGYVSLGGIPQSEGRVEIGNVLRFTSEISENDDSMDDAVVSQAPCVTLHAKLSRKTVLDSVFECDTTFAPIEIIYRHGTMSNLKALVDQIGEGGVGSESDAPDTQLVVCKEERKRQVRCSCSCSAIALSIPTLENVSTDALFERCGEVLEHAPVSESSLGILFEQISIEWNDGQDDTGEAPHLDSGAKFACHHILFFASSPIGGKLAVDAKMQRTDLLVARGRMEVEPYIPISIDIRDNMSDDQETNYGRESFPIVPAISSFKARQEDEELNIDQVLFSKLHDVDTDSRKGLRGNDPQASMLADAELSRFVVSIIVPEVTGDLTKTEMDVLLRMAQAATPSSKPASHSVKVSDTKECDNRLSVSMNFGQMSLTLHGDSFFHKSDQYSYVLMMDQFKVHSHLIGSKMKHVRLLCHDASFYEACGPASFAVQKTEQSIQNRVDFVRERSLCRSNPSAVPIVYRSHLFVPISRESPSFLLDLIDLTPAASLRSQKKVHITLYHLTYRYDVDSKWMERLATIFKEPKTEADGEATVASSNPSSHADGSSSLTRVFVSLADCNLDYTSTGYFNTVSRSIVRLGDFRLSSNIMRPAGLVQAYSVSLGDFTFYLCNRRYPHQRENSRLCRAKYLMDPADCYLDMREPVVSVYTPETLLREMGFTNVLSLDSLDAIVAMPTVGTMEHKKSSEAPKVTTSLTLGLLSLHACKDSFGCFTGTIGELQAKLTALSDADIAALKRQTRPARSAPQATPIAFQREDSSSVDENTAKDEDKDKTKDEGKTEDGEIEDRQYSPIHSHLNPEGHLALGPIMDQATLHTRNGETKPFLLDGYDWTTVDHDPLPEPEIPPGDEQVAVWYSQPEGNGTKKDDTAGEYYGIFPGRIIPQHFPLHQVSDPLAEGDMGAAKYAGAGFAPKVKSRIIVHDLTIKLRFFDGYDWPDMLSLAKRKVARDAKSFIIESNPQGVNKDKDKIAKDLAAQPDFANAGLERKAKLMGDLLDKGETKSSTFDDVPLPEERGANLERQAELRRLSRKTHRFFQVSANGLRLRMDAFEELDAHRLGSIIDLAISDLFLAETVSRTNPVKMFGEWVNENEHPRDTRHGTLMFKMVTWQPAEKVTEDNEIANDVAEVTMQLLPMRCIIDQRSISFIRAFFGSDEECDKKEDWITELHLVPPPRLRIFRVKQWKVKVDYIPKTIDFSALREGSFVELVNLNPIDGMVITLQQVNAKNEIGFGAVFGSLFRSWVQDVCATQLHKFLTHARPFEPFVSVGSGMADLVVLPYEAFKHGENVSRALRSGISALAGTVAFETLTTTSRLTQFAANQMAQVVGGSAVQARAQLFAALPPRPLETPRGVADVTGHALQSLTQGLQAANYKVVIVPYREFSRNGTTGAAKSVLKGIPVLLLAPLTGATEALSYTLLGARNSLRPDIRREEENILRLKGIEN